MKKSALHLALLDDNTLVADTLSKNLNERFNARAIISTFYDADRCMRNIPEEAHVLVLDYPVNGKAAKNGLEKYNYLSKLHPTREVILLTSEKESAGAAEELQKEITAYIIRRERYGSNILHHVNKFVVAPIKTAAFYPIRKIAHFYSVGDYLAMFIIAFASVGGLVLAGLLCVKLFS
jgi:hypothetical protein